MMGFWDDNHMDHTPRFRQITTSTPYHSIFTGRMPNHQCQIRYDMRCYFNVRSKADMSQLNLLHVEPTSKKVENRKTKN